MSRTKLFLILYFLPSWFASLMMWGDERTSEGFSAAPPWFYRTQLAAQVVAVLLLFVPLRMRRRPSLVVLFLSALIAVALYFSNPTIEAEFVLISGSVLICIVATFLAFAEPSTAIEPSDIGLLYFLMIGGFVLQIILYLGFGITPSHSAENLFVRFNGITNDSLAAGFILSMLVAWAVKSQWSAIKIPALVGAAVATGSLFSAMFVPATSFAYLLYNRLYRFAAAVSLAVAAVFAYFYDEIASIMDLKVDSVLAHLRLFLNLTGVDVRQSKISCSREFCESFIESGAYLSPIYLVAFYALLLCFIIPLLRSSRADKSRKLVRDSLRIYGLALIAGSFVHPIPLIPFAVPLFLILASLERARAERSQIKRLPSPAQRPAPPPAGSAAASLS